MTRLSSLQFKIATEPWEFEQIHQLNYRTFVEEIPQHQPSPAKRLVDKFHNENSYLICLSGGQLVGMIAVRGKRPFSLDQKLPDLDSYVPAARRLCEVRLLAVKKQFRTGPVFRGLMELLWLHALENGYDAAVISGTTRQLKLYHHMGFTAFGPLVGTDSALYQPMYITTGMFRERFGRALHRTSLSFLPGPVAIRSEVRRAFERPPESHRSSAFLKDLREAKARLCGFLGGSQAQFLLGSGTLANDAVAAQLSLQRKPGLILINGEFGERLADHARRFGLVFETVTAPWGQPLAMDAVRKCVETRPLDWVWCVHGETSTGVLNPLVTIKKICVGAKLKLCVDCISSLGVVPVDLKDIYLATGVSGKGLESYPGLSMVFHHGDIFPSARLPRYLDLGWYATHQGVPFTHSSNLVHALHVAVNRMDWLAKLSIIDEASRSLRYALRKHGYNLVASEHDAMPGVVSIQLPTGLRSARVGVQLEEAGCLVSYNSDYLLSRNWIQVCLMTLPAALSVSRVLTELETACASVLR